MDPAPPEPPAEDVDPAPPEPPTPEDEVVVEPDDELEPPEDELDDELVEDELDEALVSEVVVDVPPFS